MITWNFLQEPFECYNIADIESGIGLKRKQMVAMALLIGCDHDLQGVPGFGVETALRFVQLFDEDRILDKYVFYFDEKFLLFVGERILQHCLSEPHLLFASPDCMKLVEDSIHSQK
jgi:5'-3' exonuclease